MNISVEMWDWVLSFWQSCMEKAMAFLRQSPGSFQDGAIWGVAVSIHNTLLATGYALLVVFFLIGMFQATASFTELRRPEIVGKLFLRFILAKAAVQGGMDILLLFIRIGQGIIGSDMAASPAATGMALPEEIRSALTSAGWLDQIWLFLLSLIAVMVIVAMSLTVLLTVYGRFFKLYLYLTLAPVALSGFAGHPTSFLGISYLKAFAGICLEAAVVAIAFVLYSTFVQTAVVIDPGASASAKLLGYIVTVVLNTAILGGMVKGTDAVLQKIMNL